MSAEEILDSQDWKRCITFHGHTCPGIALGFRAAKAGLDLLKETRAADEELVAIVETDACDADAVQVLTGCTFGKGNFIYKEYGKHAFTFFSRDSGKGYRLALKPGAFEPDERHQDLIRRIREGTADRDDQAEFERIHSQRTHDVLNTPLERLFNIQAVTVPVPEKARIRPSRVCDRCGEPAMETCFTKVDGQWICHGCFEEISASPHKNGGREAVQ